MIDLKEVITKYPECLESSEKLRAYLTDLYPNEKAKVSIIVAIFSCGIANEIKRMNTIDEMVLSRYCDKLENDFGFYAKLSKECIGIWAEVYGKPTRDTYAEKTFVTSFESENVSPNTSNNRPTTANMFADIQYDESLFEMEHTSEIYQIYRRLNKYIDYKLKKYKGKDGTVVIPDGVTTILEGAFSNRNDKFQEPISSITLPNTLLSINNKAFYGLQVTNMEIPSSVAYIGAAAFSSCRKLKSISIPSGITCIEPELFRNCYNLQNINIPNSVTSIGKWAFWGCENLTSISVPDSVATIEHGAFLDCTSLVNIKLSNSLKKISSYLFSECKSIKNITIPNGVTEIENGAFSNCKSLTNINIPDSVTKIDNVAFDGCSALKRIFIPESVKTIHERAFWSCWDITIETVVGSYAEEFSKQNNIRCIIK